MKKYIAKTNVSINIVLPSGANQHITFSAVTGGGSVFYTEDPDVIQAMERHYKFGSLFRAAPGCEDEKRQTKLSNKVKPEIVPEQQPVNVSAPTTTDELIVTAPFVAGIDDIACESEQQASEEDGEADDQSVDEAENDGLKTIVVSDPDAAKAYLAEHFGYSRTKIKTLKAIKEAAAANGIVFEGI